MNLRLTLVLQGFWPNEFAFDSGFTGFLAEGLSYLVRCSRMRSSPAPAPLQGRYRRVYSSEFFPLLTKEIMVKFGDRRIAMCLNKPANRNHTMATEHDTNQAEGATYTLYLDLDADDMWALAQFVKRVGWQEFRANAASDEEAYRIKAAVGDLQSALGRAGFAPRSAIELSAKTGKTGIRL